MKRLCQFRDALGRPGEGVHAYRLGGFAVADILMTLVGAFIISWLTGIGYGWSLLGLFLLGVFLHWLFCVDTTFNKLLYRIV